MQKGEIHEGTVKKGGVNERPTSPPPAGSPHGERVRADGVPLTSLSEGLIDPETGIYRKRKTRQ